jgi:hypothetical protein
MAEHICKHPGCARPVVALGWCNMHWKRARKGIDMDMRPNKGRTPADRFWEKVDRRGPDDCWLWTGGSHSRGYGQFGLGGRLVIASRLSYEWANGPIPDGMFVCHSCDNPPCVNPAHLWLGTPADNAADKAAKGRASSLAGASNPRAKLTDGDVRAIREDPRAPKAIAAEYGVSDTAVRFIKEGRTWRHLL